MAYPNDDSDYSFYSSISGGFYSYPPPSRMFSASADTEGAHIQIYGGPADQWGMVRRSVPMVGSPTSLRATASSESVASTTSDWSTANRYRPAYDWSADPRQTQSHNSDYLSHDGPFASTTASETSSVAHIPSSGDYPLEEPSAHQPQTVPYNHWGDNRSGASTSTSYLGNVNTSHWPGTGPARTGITETERYRPYGVSRTHPNFHRNAEAGPSTLVAPHFPYIGQSRTRPSGGISETMADAKQKKSITEEHRASRRKYEQVEVPHGEGKLRPARIRSNKVGHTLCDWVRERSAESPTHNQALAVAAMIIGKKRVPVYQKPNLKKGTVERTVFDSEYAKKEHERRSLDRRLYEKLSRYYPLPEGKREWARPPLLVKVLKDLKDLEAQGDLEEFNSLEKLKIIENREGREDPEDPEDIPALPAPPEPSGGSPS